jgi:5-methylcytosine-specific restriction endonuclease McrA
MLRDKQHCTFRSRSGCECNSTHNLQIDHIKPFALGGTHEPENLRVLYAAHNRYVARKAFDEL